MAAFALIFLFSSFFLTLEISFSHADESPQTLLPETVVLETILSQNRPVEPLSMDIDANVVFPTDPPVDLGLSFNETMDGYYTLGELDFTEAYVEGKQANRYIKFTSHVVIDAMKDFVSNPLHVAAIDGRMFITNFTSMFGTTVEGGMLQVFNGSVVDHELEMIYFLPFYVENVPYHLDGVKHIYGNNCSHFLKEMTTLYSYIREGHTQGTGAIVATAIAEIDILQVIELVGSFRFVGNGTQADELDALTEFAGFLLHDVSEDCLNASNWATQFWYIWSSNGEEGFLLDLIARPEILELRLETYSEAALPVVTKQYLPYTDLFISPELVRFGDVLALSYSGCVGSVGNISVNVSFSVEQDTNNFVPIMLYAAFNGLIPEITSHYGSSLGGIVGGAQYPPSSPFTYTTYTFEVGLETVQWAMMSAPQFIDSDLKVELVALKTGDHVYIGSAYVYVDESHYHLNDPLSSKTKIYAAGENIGENKVFSASIVDEARLNLNITCSAPATQFAFLEQEGNTQIHTTVLASCNATFVTDTIKEPVSVSTLNTVLLELKSLLPF